MQPTIVDNRIAGTRITVWDVLHYLENGDIPHEQSAELLSITVSDIESAIAYINENKSNVMKVHSEIKARNARGNPPEIEIKLKQSRAKEKKRLSLCVAGG